MEVIWNINVVANFQNWKNINDDNTIILALCCSCPLESEWMSKLSSPFHRLLPWNSSRMMGTEKLSLRLVLFRREASLRIYSSFPYWYSFEWYFLWKWFHVVERFGTLSRVGGIKIREDCGRAWPVIGLGMTFEGRRTISPQDYGMFQSLYCLPWNINGM